MERRKTLLWYVDILFICNHIGTYFEYFQYRQIFFNQDLLKGGDGYNCMEIEAIAKYTNTTRSDLIFVDTGIDNGILNGFIN